MTKHLLFGTALLLVVGSFAQNNKLTKPSGALDTPLKLKDYVESNGSNSSAFIGPVKKAVHVVKPNAKVAVVTANLFTGSMNVFGYLLSQQKPLTFTKGINAVSFVARKSTTYTPTANGNSGTIVGLYSTNFGGTWNETCLWANANDLARYPQGGIYNPSGNTNINNAYLVGMGPFTSGTPSWGGPTNGQWYASKQITTPGTNTPGPDMQSNYYVGGFLKKHYMPRNSFSSIEGGLIRSMANIVNDPDNTTSNLTFGLRGHLMSKGVFNAGAFVWSTDSFIPPVNTRSDGSMLVGTSAPIQAWNETGTVGYVITIGSRSGTGLAMKGHQPIVWITTNSGATWSLLPPNDFTDPINFKGVWDRLYPLNTNTNVIVANFQGTEGMDAVVDMNGQLHLGTMCYGHYYSHNDSLGYRYVFGTEQYSYGHTGPFDFPIIYDFYTKPSGGWDYHMVDSMGTEGPSGTSGQPGYSTNPWLSGTAKLDLDARIQMSRSSDGTKIFYSWTESDSTVVGLKWNIYPDIKMKGYDLTTNKVSNRMNISTGVLGADQQSYFHYMSSRSATTGTCQTIPYTITYNGTNNGDVQVDTYYLDGVQVCNSDYVNNPMSPKGVGVGVTAANTNNYEVSNFPNPAKDMTTITVGLKTASYLEIAIYNSVGQLISTYKLNGQVGSNQINVDLTSFNSGIYLYQVKVGNSVVTKKLIVQ